VNAFRALKAKRILGITAGANGADVTKVYAKYFEDSGISVAGMERLEFNAERAVPIATSGPLIKQAFAAHKGIDAVYLLGPALEELPLIASLERDLGVPVVQAIIARVWEIQKRLNVHEPIRGFGRLLETLPV
jgi:maleate cis-trans isomerase